MKRTVLYIGLALFLVASMPACKAKHCATMDPTMEGATRKTGKQKKHRQEGLWDKRVKMR